MLANAGSFRAFGFRQALDFDLEFPLFLIEADIGLIGVIAAFAIVKAGRWAAFHIFRLKFEARRQNLFHQQAGGDGLQRIIHCFRHRLF